VILGLDGVASARDVKFKDPSAVWPSYNSPNVSNRGKSLDWNLVALIYA